VRLQRQIAAQGAAALGLSTPASPTAVPEADDEDLHK
jgi:hypothetical protein